MVKYSIIIPTWNHLVDALQPCIESILYHTDMSDVEIIVVANGCTDGTADWCEEVLKDCKGKILEFDEPIGYPKAINEGAKHASGEYLIFMNNDTYLTAGATDWIAMLEKAFANAFVGASGPVKLRCPTMNRDYIVGFLMMTKADMFKRYWMNEIYTPGSSEDKEYCIRLQDDGYEVAQVPDEEPMSLVNGRWAAKFPIFHHAELTVHNELKETWDFTFANNLEHLRKTMSKVAIVIPTYNSAQTIAETLGSVLYQTYKRWHIYICDDCSTDNTVEIIKNALPPGTPYTLLKNEYNAGPSSARNKCLEVIRRHNDCNYIAFLDSDDIWLPLHLKHSIDNLQNNSAVYCDCIFKDMSGNPVQMFGIPYYDEFSAAKLKEQNFIYISTLVHSYSYLNKVNFSPAVDSIEDWDYHLQLVNAGADYYHIKEKDVVYITKPDGMASKSTDEKYRMVRQKISVDKPVIITRPREPKIKLNLASGKDIREGYINIDLYVEGENIVKGDVAKLDYPDNYVDEILALHIIEHFDHRQAFDVLREWHRVLKPGGLLRLETPDFFNSCKWFVEGDYNMKMMLYGHFFAFPWEEGQTHKFLYTEEQLGWTLEQCGFKNPRRVDPISIYVQPERKILYLMMEAVK